MFRKVLFAKIHRARVTGSNPDYIGSITIDADLLEASGIRPNDAVLVGNCTTGERFETYVFRGERGSRVVEVNGAAAFAAREGHIVIIMHYAYMDESEHREHRPRVLLMRADNTIDRVIRYESR